jgi:alkylation response protein AidB-like acyl-CoA dehydrogenase
MDFDDSPEEAEFRAEVRAFLAAHAEPLPAVFAPPGMGGGTTEEDELAYVRACQEWQATLFDNGWAGITWPKEWGGRGGTAIQQLIWNQEMAKFDVATGVFSQGIGMAGPTLLGHGSPEQQERFLRPMLRGDVLWCQLFSEPGAGSDLAALATRAVRDGDEYVVNGQKVWSSSAHYSDWGILLARTNPDVPKHKGISYFLVDMRAPGIDVRPLRQITGAAHFNEVFFDDVRIPAANLVGAENDGWRVTITTLANERTLIGGGERGDLFGGLVALAGDGVGTTDPVIRQALLDTFVELRVIRYLGWRVQTAIAQGKQPGPESSVLKLALSDHLAVLGDLGLAVQGAQAMLLDYDDPDAYPWQISFLNQWAARIGGGTAEVQRNIIGERVLGLPGEPRLDKDGTFTAPSGVAG